MLSTLANRLETVVAQLEAIGAKQMAEALAEANRRFIALEIECRELAATQKLSKPTSMGTIRKQANATYRIIIDAINGYARICSKKAEYREMITEMNVLAAKYDQLLLARKTRNQNKRDNS